MTMLGYRVAAAAALSFAFLSPAAAQPAAQTIYVWSFSFSPKPIHLAAGRPVTLTFVNRSGSSHDFTARGFFARSRILSGDVENGEVDLGPHQTRSVTLVPAAGSYHAHCSHFLHKQLGMQDMIVVN
jgi:plastocyanin